MSAHIGNVIVGVILLISMLFLRQDLSPSLVLTLVHRPTCFQASGNLPVPVPQVMEL